MKCLASTHIYFNWVAQSYFSIREIVVLCMGESEIPYLRLRSHQELWSRSWHGWFLEQSLVRNLFYNDIFFDVLLEVEMASERCRNCLSNTSTFVPNDRSQCLHCVLPIMRCAFGAHLDVGLAERQTRADSLKLCDISFPQSREDGRLNLYKGRQQKCRDRTSSKLGNPVIVTTVFDETAASDWVSRSSLIRRNCSTLCFACTWNILRSMVWFQWAWSGIAAGRPKRHISWMVSRSQCW